MDETRPGYYAIIPADVRYDDQIPANAKLLYGEISALIGAEGFCYASNSYFMRIYGFSDPTITRLITQLEKAGHIKREMERDKAGQVTRRRIYLSVSVPEIHPPINFDTTSHQNQGEGGIKNDGYTNTSNTVLKENKKEKAKGKKPEPLTDEQLSDAVVAGIKAMAQPSWTPEVKNMLYRLVMVLYDPARVVKKARPVRSQAGVDGTFRKLAQAGNPQAMINMLNDAIVGGWQGVQVPKARTDFRQQPAEERQYQCV